ncbi:hypothetical protein [Tellurirhabdus rosea]|uniref:hypothetical protein n=1 Tax=Tellurirhabdus rosea TaxID=2674997 RepID=UPI00224D94CC|nr:hypothetical protein [Tellurirhabdus rosea]
MKDILKVVIPTAILVILYAAISGGGAEGQLVDPALWPYLIALIGTISVVAYFLMKLLRQKR